MPGMVQTIGDCSYFYEWEPSTNQWELVFWHCDTGLPDDDTINDTPYDGGDYGDDTPLESQPPQPTNTGPQALNAFITEGIRVIDNKFDRLTCPVSEPNVLDETAIQDAESWAPLRGFKTSLTASDGDVSTTLKASDFRFRIPTDAIIQGIKVEVDRTVLGSIDAAKVTADSAQLSIGKWWDQTLDIGFSYGWDAPFPDPEWIVSNDGGKTVMGFGDLDGLTPIFANHAVSPSGQYHLVVDAGGFFEGGGWAASDDYGVTWDRSPATADASNPETDGFFLAGIAWTDDRFMMASWRNFSAARTWTSLTGKPDTWTEVSGNMLFRFHRVNDYYYWPESGRFYCSGDSGGAFNRAGLKTSTGASKGAVWTDVTGTTTNDDFNSFGEDNVSYRNTLFASSPTAMVILGNWGEFSDSKIYRTTDTDVDPLLVQLTTTGYRKLSHIAYGGGTFILVEGAITKKIRRSTDDGVSFGAQEAGISGVYACRYHVASSTWVALTGGGLYKSTDDGVTWTLYKTIAGPLFSNDFYIWDKP